MRDNKTRLLMISNAILLLMLITAVILNYKNYKNYISCSRDLVENNKIIDEYKVKIEDLNSKILIQSQTREGKIKEVSINFLNSFFNFSGRDDSKKYTQIKPYSTENLLSKVKPNEEFESDTEYRSSITNINIYSEEQGESNKTATVLALAEQGVTVQGSAGSFAPTLLKLKLILVNEEWVVDDIIINRPLKNMPFFN